MAKLDGKAAIITGGGSGIGEAIARLFAQEGAKVVVADEDGQSGERVVRDIVDEGGVAVFSRTDVSKNGEAQAAVDRATESFNRLDILVNNAGIEGEQAPIGESTLDNFDRVVGVNLRGAFQCMRLAIAPMLKAGGGSIINIASVGGLAGRPNLAAYCAAKSGVIQLTRVAALEYARQGIRANVICPGAIRTPMVERVFSGDGDRLAASEATRPMGRFGLASEVARLALFLASDDSSYCTGAPFIIDGGVLAG